MAPGRWGTAGSTSGNEQALLRRAFTRIEARLKIRPHQSGLVYVRAQLVNADVCSVRCDRSPHQCGCSSRRGARCGLGSYAPSSLTGVAKRYRSVAFGCMWSLHSRTLIANRRVKGLGDLSAFCGSDGGIFDVDDAWEQCSNRRGYAAMGSCRRVGVHPHPQPSPLKGEGT